MPTTLQYRPVLIDTLISNERMSSYQSVFHSANDMELMGVYLWNAHVSGLFYPLINVAEITLRNAIDQVLEAELGSFWWASVRLQHRSLTSACAPFSVVQAVHNNFVKATRAYIADMRGRHHVRGRIKPSHAGIIAKTEFSTWEFLLNEAFMGRGLIWPKYLSSVFRGQWPVHKSHIVLLQARDLVRTLREFRNRLFHHEPAWKRYGVSTEEDALAYLQEKIVKVERLQALIHPESLRLLQVNGLLRDVRRATTAGEIRRFQKLAQIHTISSMNTLTELVARAESENGILQAKINNGDQRPFLIQAD